MNLKQWIPALIGLLVLAACAGTAQAPDGAAEQNGIVIRDAWVRPAFVEGGNGAAYMIIENTSNADDTLIGASASFAEVVEVHETFEEMDNMEDDGDMRHGEMMGMRQIPELTIPAGETVTLEVGGYHVMLIGVQETLEMGETAEVTLIFENAGEITVEAEVREQ
ncbi:MAG: copper chaperone PCu(A)C [Chloroflexi bacterium]|nr:copper chaperone PCu(A)C [Chloroflexota bacterium]